jgi:hypothetical protein
MESSKQRIALIGEPDQGAYDNLAALLKGRGLTPERHSDTEAIVGAIRSGVEMVFVNVDLKGNGLTAASAISLSKPGLPICVLGDGGRDLGIYQEKINRENREADRYNIKTAHLKQFPDSVNAFLDSIKPPEKQDTSWVASGGYI